MEAGGLIDCLVADSLAVPLNEQCYEQTMLLRRSRQEARELRSAGSWLQESTLQLLRLVNSIGRMRSRFFLRI